MFFDFRENFQETTWDFRMNDMKPFPGLNIIEKADTVTGLSVGQDNIDDRRIRSIGQGRRCSGRRSWSRCITSGRWQYQNIVGRRWTTKYVTQAKRDPFRLVEYRFVRRGLRSYQWTTFGIRRLFRWRCRRRDIRLDQIILWLLMVAAFARIRRCLLLHQNVHFPQISN